MKAQASLHKCAVSPEPLLLANSNKGVLLVNLVKQYFILKIQSMSQ